MNEKQKEILKEVVVSVGYCLLAATALVYLYNFSLAFLSEGKMVEVYINRFGEANTELIFGVLILGISLFVISNNLIKMLGLGRAFVEVST